jgi:phosphatidylglycerophosphate synthase
MVETVLITHVGLAWELIFGRTLLERLLINCERVGIGRFVIEAPAHSWPAIDQALGKFRADPRVLRVASLATVEGAMDAQASALLLCGNLVLFKSHLTVLLTRATGANSLAVVPADPPGTGLLACGRLADLLQAQSRSAAGGSGGDALPFALVVPGDRREAERRLGRAVRVESVARDAPLARAIDRKLSWRLSWRLARTPVTPNQITIANSLLGCGCALLFSQAGFLPRAGAGLAFLAITTLDGVDGEVARLKLRETEAGAALDIITDTIVNLIVFVGIFIGCYRAGGNPVYLRLLGLMAGGYGLCALAYYWAVGAAGEAGARYTAQIDRWTSRDFSYLLLVFALANRLEWFAWGIALGTYAFAFALVIVVALTRLKRGRPAIAGASPGGER